MNTIDGCTLFQGPNTGFEDVEYNRRITQIAATMIIATTFFLLQILMLLLFFPIPQFPRFLRRLDIEFNFLEFSVKKKNGPILSEEDQLIESDIIEQNKRSKRASGGLATVIVVVLVIVISTASFVVTQDGSGSVIYQSSKLAKYKFMNSHSVPKVGMAISTLVSEPVQLVYRVITYRFVNGWPRTCKIEKMKNGTEVGERIHSFDVVGLPQNYGGLGEEKTWIYVTACGNYSRGGGSRIKTAIYTPVQPSLSQYPPPGIFTDTPIEDDTQQMYNNIMQVLPYKWTWVEMVSSSAIDLLSSVTSKRYLQPKISPQPMQTRGPNDTFTVYFSNTLQLNYTWPRCDRLGDTFSPLFSFYFDIDPKSSANESYIVSESSLLSWFFATIITIGSVIALKPSIAYYLQKFHNYWTMKGWLRWLLFSIYTVLVPGPFIYIYINNFVFLNGNLDLRGQEPEYFFYLQSLLMLLTLLLMVTWFGVLARNIKTSVDSCKRKRQEREKIDDSIISEDAQSRENYTVIP